MIEMLMAHNAIIREVLNGSLFPLFVFLSVMIAFFLWDLWMESESFTDWTRAPGAQTACVLFWIFLAVGVRSGQVWAMYRWDLTRYIVTSTTMPNPLNNVGVVVFTVTAVILILGVLRATFLFTPPKWGNWAWVGSAVATIVFNFLSIVLDN